MFSKLRERHYMVLILLLIYCPLFFDQRLTARGSYAWLHDQAGDALYLLYGISFLLAAFFLTFYPARASHMILAGMPQFFYSIVSVDYVLKDPEAIWQSPLFHIGFSLSFAICIGLRYRRYRRELVDN